MVGGDFNAMLGDPCEGDDTDILGTCAFGQRNDRGWMLALVLSWLHDTVPGASVREAVESFMEEME